MPKESDKGVECERYNCMVVPVGDVEALTNALERLIEDAYA